MTKRLFAPHTSLDRNAYAQASETYILDPTEAFAYMVFAFLLLVAPMPEHSLRRQCQFRDLLY